MLEFVETSGRNLLAAEAAAGVRHHVGLSIVGTDRSDNGYFRAKVAQEKLIETSGIPYTVIRSIQFLEFLGGIAGSNAEGNIVRLSLSQGQARPSFGRLHERTEHPRTVRLKRGLPGAAMHARHWTTSRSDFLDAGCLA